MYTLVKSLYSLVLSTVHVITMFDLLCGLNSKKLDFPSSTVLVMKDTVVILDLIIPFVNLVVVHNL